MTKRLLPVVCVLGLLAAACGEAAASINADDQWATPPLPTAPDATAPPTVDSIPATASPDPHRDQLVAARESWAAHGFSSYRLATRQSCFCPDIRWVDTVVDGLVVSHVSMAADSSFDPGQRTMETLFDEIDATIAAGYFTLDLEFDPETGAVVRYWVDVDERMADEEHGVEVISVEPIDPALAIVTTAG